MSQVWMMHAGLCRVTQVEALTFRVTILAKACGAGKTACPNTPAGQNCVRGGTSTACLHIEFTWFMLTGCLTCQLGSHSQLCFQTPPSERLFLIVLMLQTSVAMALLVVKAAARMDPVQPLQMGKTVLRQVGFLSQDICPAAWLRIMVLVHDLVTGT